MNMGKKFGMIKEEVKPVSDKVTQKPTLPCTSETECKKYCVSHPDECPGMAGRPNTNASDTALSKPANVSTQKGDFLGPSGCKTEDECKAFCEKHPGECPGFPKKPEQTNVNPSIMPSNPDNQTSGKTSGKYRSSTNKQSPKTQGSPNVTPANSNNSSGANLPIPSYQPMNPPPEISSQVTPPPNHSEFPR